MTTTTDPGWRGTGRSTSDAARKTINGVFVRATLIFGAALLAYLTLAGLVVVALAWLFKGEREP